MNTTKQYSRADYMNGKVSHAEYYGQFVTPEIKAMVEQAFGYQLRNRTHDEHLNDIPLKQWDRLAGVTNPGWEARGGSPLGVIKLADDNSLASTVCVLKQAAKQLIAESKQTESLNMNTANQTEWRAELSAKQARIVAIAKRRNMPLNAPISDLQCGAPTVQELQGAIYPDFVASIDSFLNTFDNQ